MLTTLTVIITILSKKPSRMNKQSEYDDLTSAILSYTYYYNMMFKLFSGNVYIVTIMYYYCIVVDKLKKKEVGSSRFQKRRGNQILCFLYSKLPIDRLT